MARELLILRHGKSDWDAGQDDFHRPLKDRGKRAAQRMGVWMRRQQLLPDYIVSSPAERALATAQKLCKAMGAGTQGIVCDERIYEATASELLDVLADCPDGAQRVLLVGHNPGLEDLLLLLAREPLEIMGGCKLLPTAALARLTLPDDWHKLTPECALLESIMHPGTLPRKFPFPGPDGE
jgi:phosphohistidine phosphatase